MTPGAPVGRVERALGCMRFETEAAAHEVVGAALEAVFRDAARLARLVDAYAAAADDLPASTLDALRRDFDAHADALVGLPALAETALVGCLT